MEARFVSRRLVRFGRGPMLPHGPWGKTLDVLRRAHDRGGGGVREGGEKDGEGRTRRSSKKRPGTKNGNGKMENTTKKKA